MPGNDSPGAASRAVRGPGYRARQGWFGRTDTLGRIDLHVEVPAVPFTQLAEMPPRPILGRPASAGPGCAGRQEERFGPSGAQVNGRMTPRQVRKFWPLNPADLSGRLARYILTP